MTRSPAGRTAVLELIARIGTEFGISILVASHLLDSEGRTILLSPHECRSVRRVAHRSQ